MQIKKKKILRFQRRRKWEERKYGKTDENQWYRSESDFAQPNEGKENGEKKNAFLPVKKQS